MALGKSTAPLKDSVYPLALVSTEEEARQASTRFMAGVMVVMVLASYLIVVPLINNLVDYLGYRLQGSDLSWGDYADQATAFGNIWGVLAAHLGLAAMILVVWAYLHFIHHRPLSWLWSVSPGVRWRYGLICLMVALVVIGAVTAYHWFSGTGWQPMAGWGWYVGVILVTTPFQALAEEVLFRGYLMQLFGSIVRQVWFPIIATAVVFALFHGTQNPWLFGSRLVFGILAGVLVWRTGGLEAAVAIHIINNLCAFGLAIGLGNLSELRTTTTVDWGQAVLDVGMFAVCAAACWGIAVKMRVPIRARG